MVPTSNDSTLVLEGFLTALLRHHGEASCVDDNAFVDKFIPFKVNVIFDNCAIHQTKHTTVSKRYSKYDSRTLPFKVSSYVEDRPAVPPFRTSEQRDTCPLIPRSYPQKTSGPASEEQDGQIPKQSLHQSSTRDMASTTYRFCADAAAGGAAEVHCNSRWSSSPPVMRESRKGYPQRNCSADHGLHGRFPTPPLPARRQVSIDRDNSTELVLAAAGSPSSNHEAITVDLGGQDESIQHMPGSLPNNDCNNVISLVDHALQAIAI